MFIYKIGLIYNMILPIIKKLRKKAHKDTALAQDLMVIELYNALPEAVIHGGTALWRCYGSNRFSEDIDVYLPRKLKQSEHIKAFLNNLKRRGFTVNKFREKQNSIFSVFSYMGTVVRFEAVFEYIRSSVKPYEMSDGTFISVRTLEPNTLIMEKAMAYKKRKKIRDLYDVYFLLGLVEKTKETSEMLLDFVKGFEEPVDKADLKAIIISGIAPEVKGMLEMIVVWAR